MKLKSEIRNPKSETNSKFETSNLRFISNFVLCASCLLVCSSDLTIFAQGFVPLAEIPGLTSGVTADTAGLAKFFNNLYRFTIGMAAVLAVIMIIWGGLETSTQDSISKKSAGKQRIYNAIFGLVLVLSPVLVFSIINPKILNLSLNLPPLDTAPGIPGGGGGTAAQAPATVDANGCSVTGTLLKTASCPTQSVAQQFVASCALTGRLSTCSVENADGTSGCTTYTATCGGVAGPYAFIDVSSAYIPSIGSPLLNSSYQPLVTSASSMTNGADVMNFVATCSPVAGCFSISPSISTIPCTYTTPQPTSQNNRCYSDKISCTAKPYFGCSNPNWTP